VVVVELSLDVKLVVAVVAVVSKEVVTFFAVVV
jgi:hypothetical protein